MANVASGQSLYQEDLRGIHKDGSRIKIQFSSSPVSDAQGNVTGILATFINQSQR